MCVCVREYVCACVCVYVCVCVPWSEDNVSQKVYSYQRFLAPTSLSPFLPSPLTYYLWHDSFIRVTWCCNMWYYWWCIVNLFIYESIYIWWIYSYTTWVFGQTFLNMWYYWFNMWHDSFISVTWLILARKSLSLSLPSPLTYYVWHDSFIRVTWCLNMRDVTDSICDMHHS